MDAIFKLLQKHRDALQQSNGEATSTKLNGMEKTMQKTLKAVKTLTTALESQACTLNKITHHLEQMQLTPKSLPDSPMGKRQVTKAKNLTTKASNDLATPIKDLSQMAFDYNKKSGDDDPKQQVDDDSITESELFADNKIDEPGTPPPAALSPRK